MEPHAGRLTQRLDALRGAVLDLARAVDENLRSVLLLLTTDESVAGGTSLHSTKALEEAVLERSMDLLGLQGPVARDLRWALAMIRVGTDYERVQNLVEALHRRVERLSGTLLDEILHVMIDVMRNILRLHAPVLAMWEKPAETAAIPREEILQARRRIDRSLREAEDRAIRAMIRGEETAANLRDLVLACRHLKRIARQIASIPDEFEDVPPREAPAS